MVKRGDLVTVALQGDLGKPRLALIIQSDRFDQTGTVTVLPISGTLVDAPLIRTTIEPTPTNGLRKRSQVMVDKAASVKRDKIGAIIGHLEAEAMLGVTRALAVFFAIA
jgi:mRNA interferase MazF